MRSPKHVKKSRRAKRLKSKNAISCRGKAYVKRLELQRAWQEKTVFTGYRIADVVAPPPQAKKIKEPKQLSEEEYARRRQRREQKRIEREISKQKASTSTVRKAKKPKKAEETVLVTSIDKSQESATKDRKSASKKVRETNEKEVREVSIESNSVQGKKSGSKTVSSKRCTGKDEQTNNQVSAQVLSAQLDGRSYGEQPYVVSSSLPEKDIVNGSSLSSTTTQLQKNVGKPVKEQTVSNGATTFSKEQHSADPSNETLKNELVNSAQTSNSSKTESYAFKLPEIKRYVPVRRPLVHKLLKQDIDFCVYMIETYGDDYEAMSKDELNVDEGSARVIQRKIRVFKESPEYEESREYSRSILPLELRRGDRVHRCQPYYVRKDPLVRN
uniref:Nucleolar protein 16 n=1 Tax=Syphacia muris TaxID=451379 RepID=A0A0N5AT26_9BILA